MQNIKAVILAAGKGTRMKSDLPKVVHKIHGKCLVDYVIEAARGAGAQEICLVVGYKQDIVCSSVAHKDVSYVLQPEQLEFLGEAGTTMILFGDTPLITSETLKRLAEYHEAHKNAVTVLSALTDDPDGYGRIIRDAHGNFIKSVEHKDATSNERESHEINSGMYLFDTKELKYALDRLRPNNSQGEYYLPDALEIIKEKGLRVDAYRLGSSEDITGVNDQDQLAAAADVIALRQRQESRK